MGCLYLEIEGHSCLMGSVDQGLMKNRQKLTCWTAGPKKEPEKKHFSPYFPHSDVTPILSANNPKKTCKLLGQTIGFPLS